MFLQRLKKKNDLFYYLNIFWGIAVGIAVETLHATSVLLHFFSISSPFLLHFSSISSISSISFIFSISFPILFSSTLSSLPHSFCIFSFSSSFFFPFFSIFFRIFPGVKKVPKMSFLRGVFLLKKTNRLQNILPQ